MTVWDTFMLRDELDMLECRLVELAPIVDLFVITEAPFTHGRRDPKPFHLLHNYGRFARWSPQIRYVMMTPQSVPDGPDPWLREHAQREACLLGMPDVADEDLVMHGDIDEIPTRGIVREAWWAVTTPVVMEQRMAHYCVDWLDSELWPGTIAARWEHVNGFQAMRARRWELPRLRDGGWHLSSVGDAEYQKVKLHASCHEDDARDEGAYDLLVSGEAARLGIHQGQRPLIAAEVDETWPRYIYERRCPASWFRPRPGPEMGCVAACGR